MNTAASRPPRVGWLLFFWIVLAGLLGGGIYYLTRLLWIAIPAGALGGYVALMLLTGGRGGCVPPPLPPSRLDD